MTLDKMGTGGLPSEPFSMSAETYIDMGLSVFPCMGDDGKKPCVKWGSLQKRRIGSKGLDKWLAAFPDANIGIVTGKLSDITVIDCDNPKVTTRELCDKYGETPLIVKTPSGGYHLYYKYNGEGCSQNVQQKIDIRGAGGFIIAPPSFNRITGEIYHFIEGGIWEIKNLPFIKNNSEIQREYSEGERNKALFNYLKTQAISCHDISVLTSLAEKFNQQHLNPPLNYNEIQRTVNSISKYKDTGTLYKGGTQWLNIEMSDKVREMMFTHPPAFSLYIDLLSCHKDVHDKFAISPRGYSTRAQWGEKTIRGARDKLIECQLIECVHKGGKKPKDVSLYRFSAWG